MRNWHNFFRFQGLWISVTKNNLLLILESIGRLSSDGILLFSVREKKLEYVNQALLQMFDISHQNFSHEPAFFLNHIPASDLEYLQAEFERLLKHGKVESVEFNVKDHQHRVRNLNASCYALENGKYIVGLFRDITADREHENYIINYGAKKNALLDMVTHNLSGPLMFSKTMIESLESMIQDKDFGNIKAQITLIKENTRHCIDVVTDFLEEEHLVSEQIHVKRSRFEVVDKVETVLERVRKSYPEFRFVITRNKEEIYINNDDVKFLQVVNNLLSNAVKWSPAKSVIEVIVREYESFITIDFHDHGVGIPKELQETIFQKKTQAMRPGLRGEKSIGMGLYIVKKLVGLMGGTVTLESEENKGTRVTLTFSRDTNGATE